MLVVKMVGMLDLLVVMMVYLTVDPMVEKLVVW